MALSAYGEALRRMLREGEVEPAVRLATWLLENLGRDEGVAQVLLEAATGGGL